MLLPGGLFFCNPTKLKEGSFLGQFSQIHILQPLPPYSQKGHGFSSTWIESTG